MNLRKTMRSVCTTLLISTWIITPCFADSISAANQTRLNLTWASRSNSSWSSHYDTGWYEPTASSYIINDAADLAAFAVAVNSGQTFAGKTVTLNGDIDLSPYTWEPIGRAKYQSPSSEDTAYTVSTLSTRFQGVFDGNGKTISHMNLSNTNIDDSYGRGLFAINAGTIKNLTLTDSLITGTCGINGGIAGIVDTGGKVSGCKLTDTVTIKANTKDANGGIAGYILPQSEINECVNEAEITGSQISGGIVGMSVPAPQDAEKYPSVLSHCENKGLVSGHTAGGVIGESYWTHVEQCANSGVIDGSDNTGELIGLKNESCLQNS